MSNAIQNVSLYIPHVFANFSKEYIANVFDFLNIGRVNNIDFVSKMGKDGKPFNAAYIHFEFWFNTAAAFNFQQRVINPDMEARLVYDDPWYWIVLENKASKTLPGSRKQRINITGDNPAPFTPTNINLQKTANLLQFLRAPVKNTTSSISTKLPNPVNLGDYFEAAADLQEEDADYHQMMEEMEECETHMQEQDSTLVSIDARYIRAIEQENAGLRAQLIQTNTAYYAETIRAQALQDAFQKLHND